MQVTLQSLFSSTDDHAIIIETNSHATVQTLVSTFCSQRGIAYDPKLGVYDVTKAPLTLRNTLQSAGVTNGQTLYIGYPNRLSNSPSVKWPVYVAVFALIIGVAGILTMSLVYGLHGGDIPFDFGVVMDAGSSKTNTLLYKWMGDKQQGTGCVSQNTSCSVKGGIAKGNPEERIDRILECIHNVSVTVEKKKIPATPLYFAATAGMRLLNLSNPEKVENILNMLSTNLNKSGLSVKDISIISGRDEGIYGWITTNFLKNTLDVKNTNPFSPVTYGALDMGGASAQISFAVPRVEGNEDNPEIQRMTLYGEIHDVYAKSNLCFGRDEATRRYRALLIENPLQDHVDDPCAPRGFNQSVTANSILNETCTQSPKFEDWYLNYPQLEKHTYNFTGKSNYEKCKETINTMLDVSVCEDAKFKECFLRLTRDLENQKFMAFASYYYTTFYLNLTSSTLENYVQVTKEFCERDYSDIPGNNYAAQYCFTAMYIHAVLLEGYGFNETTWNNLEFAGEVDDKELGWPLGYMINATNLIPAKKPTARLIHPAVLTIFLVIFIIAVAATIVYLFHTVCRKKEEANMNGSAQSLYQSP